jgi:hypothetical protein
VKSLKYFVPDLKELADIFRTALQSNFKIVEVTVGDCPDLREWGLAGQGLHSSGHLKGYHDSTQSHIISQSQATCLVDVGGINNMNFIKNHYHLWDLTDIAHDVHLSDQAFFIGAGAASSRVAGDNCELMPNTHLGHKKCLTKSAEVDKRDGKSVLLKEYNSNEFGSLCNVYGSLGLPGLVIRVVCQVRTGPLNPITCLRTAVARVYGATDRPVGVGGVFRITNGIVKSHVMPNFPTKDLLTQEDVDGWLKYYRVGPVCRTDPLVCLSIFQGSDLSGWDLRLEHTHFFQKVQPGVLGIDGGAIGHGGHYHYDLTPDTIEYEGYFLPAQYLYRVDQPHL